MQYRFDFIRPLHVRFYWKCDQLPLGSYTLGAFCQWLRVGSLPRVGPVSVIGEVEIMLRVLRKSWRFNASLSVCSLRIVLIRKDNRMWIEYGTHFIIIKHATAKLRVSHPFIVFVKIVTFNCRVLFCSSLFNVGDKKRDWFSNLNMISAIISQPSRCYI